MQLDYHIEGLYSQEECVGAVLQWLSAGDYTPDDILTRIQYSIERHFQPLYFFHMEYQGNAYAKLGVERQESYAMHGNTHQRTVTDWLPQSYYANGKVEVVVYAGEEESKSIRKFYEGLSLRDKLKTVHVIDKEFYQLGRLFVYSKETQWRKIGLDYATDLVKYYEKRKIRSDAIRDFDVSIKFSPIDTYSFVAPYWLFSYTYDNQQFIVLVDGTDITRIAGSPKPVDRERKRRIRTLKIISWLSGILLTGAGIFINLSYPSEYTMAVNVGLAVSGIVLPWAIVSARAGRIKIESRKRRQRVLDALLDVGKTDRHA